MFLLYYFHTFLYTPQTLNPSAMQFYNQADALNPKSKPLNPKL